MALSPAFAVDGSRVPASMLRMMNYVATSGATGVVRSYDLRVTALTIPAGQVNIAPGGAVIATGYNNSTPTQSYAVSNDATITLDIPPTGGTARTDYVCIRIDDPEYGGQVPSEPLDALYCRAVRLTSINNPPYPYIALARIDIPANTGTITSSMITDLRKVAVPRHETKVLAEQFPDGELIIIDSNDSTYTNVITHYGIEIPEWATHVTCSASFGGILLTNGSVIGRANITLSSLSEETWQCRMESEDKIRTTYVAGGEQYVPQNRRGTTRNLVWRLKRTSGPGHILVDKNSTFIATLTFEERAAPEFGPSIPL